MFGLAKDDTQTQAARHTHVFEHVLILTRYIFAVMRWYSRKVLNQG